jgi:hypothetical protein
MVKMEKMRVNPFSVFGGEYAVWESPHNWNDYANRDELTVCASRERWLEDFLA